MVLKIEEANILHARLAKASKEELEKEFDQKLEEQNSMKFGVKNIKEPILSFLSNPSLISGAYSQAGQFVSLYENVEAGKKINVIEVRILQKFLVEAKFSTLQEAKEIHNLLKSLQEINTELGRLEETARAIAEYIQKAETAEKTGLEYKGDDSENVAKLSENAGALEGQKAAKDPVKKTEKKAKMKPVK